MAKFCLKAALIDTVDQGTITGDLKAKTFMRKRERIVDMGGFLDGLTESLGKLQPSFWRARKPAHPVEIMSNVLEQFAPDWSRFSGLFHCEFSSVTALW